MPRHLSLAALCAALAAPLAGCGEDEPAAEDAPLVSIAGAEVAGATYTVRLDAATPDPPIRSDVNAWRFTLLDAAGAGVEGCTFDIEPTMPAHGHGTTPDPSATELGDGAYEMRPLNFTMPGEWHVAIRPTCGTTTDEIVVVVDIQS